MRLYFYYHRCKHIWQHFICVSELNIQKRIEGQLSSSFYNSTHLSGFKEFNSIIRGLCSISYPDLNNLLTNVKLISVASILILSSCSVLFPIDGQFLTMVS